MAFSPTAQQALPKAHSWVSGHEESALHNCCVFLIEDGSGRPAALGPQRVVSCRGSQEEVWGLDSPALGFPQAQA